MAGRPTKLTPELQEEICKRIRAGTPATHAGMSCGVKWDTHKEWRSKGRQGVEPYATFVHACDRAFADSVVGMIGTVVKEAKKGNAGAAMSFLERRTKEFQPPRFRADLTIELMPNLKKLLRVAHRDVQDGKFKHLTEEALSELFEWMMAKGVEQQKETGT